MQNEILTREKLHRFKLELIEEIKQTIKTDKTVTKKQFLRRSEVRKLLKISSGTLQNLHIKGILRNEKISGIFYYSHADIVQLLDEIGSRKVLFFVWEKEQAEVGQSPTF